MDADAPAQVHPDAAPPRDRDAGQTLRTLLVVDDQPANIEVLYRTLKDSWRVLMATSGEMAVALCRSNPPELVLLDVVMPGMDGYEVCRQLKSDPSTRDIPIIFVTAHSDPIEEARGLALGAVDFVAKPISPPVVRTRVESHVAFARSNRLLNATLEATADGIVVTDLQGRISLSNRRFAELWNLPVAAVVPGDGAAVWAAMQREVAGDPGAVTLPNAGPFADHAGQPQVIALSNGRHLEHHQRPLLAHGKVVGLSHSFRDITERLRSERSLAQMNQELEQRIVERTRELDLARQRADAANRAKSELLSNMSHEMRTPMNSILGMAHLALRGELDAKLRGYLTHIDLAGRHLLDLINDILDMAKVEAGKLTLERRDFELSDVFAKVSLQLAAVAAAKGLGLTLDIAPELSRPLCGDPMRIGQVLLNYVGNAIKFSDAGDVTLTAHALDTSAAGAVVRFEVRDRGVGIDAASLGTLFQPFQQADASTTRKYGGTGLGLAICKQLAELMGGEVGASSEPGVGSVFTMTVTLAWGEARSDDAAKRGGQGATPVKYRLDGVRVLVVDDNVVNQQIAVEMLESVGATVRIAGNGQQALDVMVQGVCDCVLMDVQMPLMDGLQATRLARANLALAGLPILAMTANAGCEDERSCREAGMDDFITKPVMPARLYELIARHVGIDAHDAAAASPAARPRLAGDEDFDLSMLRDQVGGDEAKVHKFARIFLEAMSDTLVEMDEAVARRDLASLRSLGHRAKSSARTVGAVALADLCETLERSTGDIDGAVGIAGAVRSQFAWISRSIEKALALAGADDPMCPVTP